MYCGIPELVKAIEQLHAEKFRNLMVYLKNPLRARVWTDNQAERTKRMIRLLEKVRYEWRRRMTLVRFMVRTLERVWKERTTSGSKASAGSKPRNRDDSQAETMKRPRAV